MVTVFESIMLICFGLSWPISVYKSWTSKSTKGKSLIFTIAIIVGYIAGIAGKIVGGNFNYVFVLYLINPGKADPLSQYIMCVVLFDLTAFILYLLITYFH